MRAEELEALRKDMLAVIAAGAFALRDTIGKSAFDERVMTAMGKVPRHTFVPIELQPYAYANIPLPIGSTLLQPSCRSRRFASCPSSSMISTEYTLRASCARMAA